MARTASPTRAPGGAQWVVQGGSASGSAASATVPGPAGPGKHAHFKFPARPAVVPSTQAAAAIVAGGDSNWGDGPGGNQAGGCVPSLEAA